MITGHLRKTEGWVGEFLLSKRFFAAIGGGVVASVGGYDFVLLVVQYCTAFIVARRAATDEG
jgi:hypothetical protein